ncbi:MAG TPA: hypothetical protein VGI81_00775 [Tepidisphaeraceae bacterium]|jgi:hypothetical protein
MRLSPLLALLAAPVFLAACDSRALAKPNPRINAWNHVLHLLNANEAVVDVTNDGGPGWVRIEVQQDGKPVGATDAYFATGQEQVVRFPLASTVWKMQLVTRFTCTMAPR